ncbi:hypothetical protein LR48_Vigan09g127800 [Vigna angularis]|uniref:Uncharacterized protein n=1 Tax=Phaseolus angularis TaxID=3914 RepID=A0A0L9VD70_PHAAN|nr:hypothetical protein LR48_Vigan09g127800 [Vigna angularis]
MTVMTAGQQGDQPRMSTWEGRSKRPANRVTGQGCQPGAAGQQGNQPMMSTWEGRSKRPASKVTGQGCQPGRDGRGGRSARPLVLERRPGWMTLEDRSVYVGSDNVSLDAQSDGRPGWTLGLCVRKTGRIVVSECGGLSLAGVLSERLQVVVEAIDQLCQDRCVVVVWWCLKHSS